MSIETTECQIPSLYKNEIDLLDDFEPNKIYEIEVFPEFNLKCLYSTENDNTFHEFINDIDNPQFSTLFFKNTMISDMFISICTDHHVLLLPTSSVIQVDETLDRIKDSTVYCIGQDDHITLSENYNSALLQNFGSDEKLSKIREKLTYRLIERFEVYTSAQSVVVPNKTSYSTFFYLTEEVISTFYDLIRSHRSLSALSQTASASALEDNSRLPSLYRKEIDIFSKFEIDTIYEIEILPNFTAKCLLFESNEEVFNEFLNDIQPDTVSTLNIKQSQMNNDLVTICIDNHICLMSLLSPKLPLILSKLESTKLYCLIQISSNENQIQSILKDLNQASSEEIQSIKKDLNQKVLHRFDICNLALALTVSFRSSVSSYFYMTQEAISVYYDLKYPETKQNLIDFPPNTNKAFTVNGTSINCVYSINKLDSKFLENARFNPKTAYHFIGNDLTISCSNQTILLINPDKSQLNDVFFYLQNCELFPVTYEDQETFSRFYYIDDRHIPCDKILDELRKELINEISRLFPCFSSNAYLQKTYEGILAYEVFKNYHENLNLTNLQSTISLIDSKEFDLSQKIHENEIIQIQLNKQIIKCLLYTHGDILNTFLSEIGCDQYVCVDLKAFDKQKYLIFYTNHHLLFIENDINDVLYQIQNSEVFCLSEETRSELFKYFKFDLLKKFSTQNLIKEVLENRNSIEFDGIKLNDELTYSSLLYLAKDVIECYDQLHIRLNEMNNQLEFNSDDELASSEEVDNDADDKNKLNNVIQRNIGNLLDQPDNNSGENSEESNEVAGYTFKSCNFSIFHEKMKQMKLNDNLNKPIELNQINSKIRLNRYQNCNCLISTAEPLVLSRYLSFVKFDRVISYHFAQLNGNEYLTLCSKEDLIVVKNPTDAHLNLIINSLNRSLNSIVVPVNSEDLTKFNFNQKMKNVVYYQIKVDQIYKEEFEYQEPFTVSSMMHLCLSSILTYLYYIQKDECELFKSQETQYKYLRENISIYNFDLFNRFEINTVRQIELVPNKFVNCLLSQTENLVLQNYLNYILSPKIASFNFSSSPNCNSSFFTLCTGNDLIVLLNPTAETLSIVFKKIQKSYLIPVNVNDIEKLKFYDYSGQLKNLLFVNQLNEIQEEIENCKQQIFSDKLTYSNQFDYSKFLSISYKTYLTHLIRSQFISNKFNSSNQITNEQYKRNSIESYHLYEFIKLRSINNQTDLVMNRNTYHIYLLPKYSSTYEFNQALYTYKHLEMSCLSACFGIVNNSCLLTNYSSVDQLNNLVNPTKIVYQLVFGLAYLHLKGQFPINLTRDNIIIDSDYNIQLINYDQIPLNVKETPERFDLLNLSEILLTISRSNPLIQKLYDLSQIETSTVCDLVSFLIQNYPETHFFSKQLPMLGEVHKMFEYDEIYQNIIEIDCLDHFAVEFLKTIVIGKSTSFHFNEFNDFIFNTLDNSIIIKNPPDFVINKLLEKMAFSIIIPQTDEDLSNLFRYYGFDYLHNFLTKSELQNLRKYNLVTLSPKSIEKSYLMNLFYNNNLVITESLQQVSLDNEMAINQVKKIIINDLLTVTCLSSNSLELIDQFIQNFKDLAIIHFNSSYLSICSNSFVLLTNLDYEIINQINKQIQNLKIYSVDPDDRSKLFEYYTFDLIKNFASKSEIDSLQTNLLKTIKTLFKFNFNLTDLFTVRSFFNLNKETISFYYLLTNGIEEEEVEFSKFNEYMKYAERGNSSALFNVGVMHSRGIGVTQNKQKAAEYYQKAADLGHSKAQLNLSLMYSKGNGVNEDKQKAFELCKQSAEQGNVKAQSNLGSMYSKGEGCEKNLENAIHWYTIAGDNGDSESYLNLALIYENVLNDKEKAIDYYQKAADLGNPKAQFNLGTLYHRSQYLKKDNCKAVELYTMAANQGLAQAQFNLGVLYQKGDEDIPKDEEKAMEYFTMAAEQNDSDALLNLGAIYAKLNNYEKTVELYQRAADLNNHKAQFNLGIMYSKGEYVRKDNSKAAMYFEKSIELPQSKYNLACMLLKGDGVPEDKERAIKLLEEAANEGNAKAQFNLAVLYQKGDGVPKDINKAIDLYNKAAMKNNSDALLNLGVIYAEGTENIEQDIPKAFECYQKAALLNSTKAMLYLGLLYKQNLYEQKENKDLAVEWLTKSADKGNSQAMFLLGKIYLNPEEHDNLVSQDLDKSEYYLKNASKYNHEALLYLGDLYLMQNKANEAKSLYQQALELGVENASYRLMKFNDPYEEIFDRLLNEISQLHQKTHQNDFQDYKQTLGDIIDYINIPLEHTTKKGLSDCIYTYKQSNEILKQITNEVNEYLYNKQSHLPSLHSNQSLNSNPIEVNDVDEIDELNKEIKRLELQLEQVQNQVQCELNQQVQLHEPIISRSALPPSPRSQRNRIKNLMQQAENGDSTALFSLGACYALGDGVEQNREKALEYYLKAADMGNKNAQFACASCFSYGKGTDVDKIRALEYYLKAAEQGHPKAEFAVGHFYEYGQGGLTADHETAKTWYRKAANQGYQAARKALEMFSSEATLDDYSVESDQ